MILVVAVPRIVGVVVGTVKEDVVVVDVVVHSLEYGLMSLPCELLFVLEIEEIVELLSKIEEENEFAAFVEIVGLLARIDFEGGERDQLQQVLYNFLLEIGARHIRTSFSLSFFFFFSLSFLKVFKIPKLLWSFCCFR